MCIEVYEQSKNAYDALYKYMPLLPNSKIIEDKIKSCTQNFSECITDITKIPEIISSYKENYKIINTTKIYAALAVDALFFKPDVTVDSTGITSGFENEIQLSKKEYTLFSRDLNSFTKFIKSNWYNIIKSGFVFQMNPLHENLRPIVLYIHPSCNGKSNPLIIDMLYKIRKILHNLRVEIVSFTFDGDNGYSNLNELFYQSYINRLIKKNIFSNERILMVRISPDFMHLCKRLRYT